MWFQDFQDDHSDAYHQVSAQSNLRFGRRCYLKTFKMAAMDPSWILERNDFCNSVSLCRSDASHQVSAPYNLWVWEEMSFEEFQDGRQGGNLGYLNRTI